ncbi:NUDIX domain-containing protein [Chryseobacterium proteolyticum]|uniref:NUDIX domain-containing protein n=1 Tax=Chryseobacterium proteolyticum TaxID=118127 RepID=UPI00398382DE
MNQNFIHTYVSVDCVVFGFDHENRLNILLVQRHVDDVPLEKQIKLPGSLIFSDEDVDDAAQRVLHELTGIKKNGPQTVQMLCRSHESKQCT